MMEAFKAGKTRANAYGKATIFRPFSSCKSSVHIKTFWVTTVACFSCFFVWFANIHLISWIQRDINLSARSINISKAVLTISTIISRTIIGDLCDKIGARYCYILMMIITIFPLCLLSLITNSTQYIICNMFIGIVGSGFVVTQYHTSQFFTDRLVGITNATSAGWGNFGFGCAAFIMPLIANNTDNVTNWRYLTLGLGLFLIVPILLYYYVAQDNINGNLEYKKVVTLKNLFNMSGFKTALRDYRTWILFLVYMLSFGVEVTVTSFMSTYFMYQFDLNVGTAGAYVFMFSSLNLFARSAGGYGSDVLYRKYGIQGRVYTLFLVLLSESIFLCIFSFGTFSLGYSTVIMLFFSFYVHCAEGITFSIVPFIGCGHGNIGSQNRKIGCYYGIVAAGGNFGASIFSILFFFTPNGSNTISYKFAFSILAVFIFCGSFLTLKIKFTLKEIREADELLMSFLKNNRIYGDKAQEKSPKRGPTNRMPSSTDSNANRFVLH